METVKTIAPIFILKTRSFWLGIFPLLLTALDILFSGVTSGTGGPIVDIIALVFGYSAADVQALLLKLAPVWGLIIAQQRGGWTSGIPRPYTLDPKKEEEVITAVENGKTAFEAGKQLGESLKGALRR